MQVQGGDEEAGGTGHSGGPEGGLQQQWHVGVVDA